LAFASDPPSGEAVLVEYVFLEVVTVVRARSGKDAAMAVAKQLLQAREVEFIPCSELFLDFRKVTGVTVVPS